MNMHQEYNNSDENYWPPTDQPSEPRYKAPLGYSATAWTENPAAVHNIPLPILQRAETRVKAQKAFFKHLFIYTALVSGSWLLGIGGFVENPTAAIFVPIIITVLGGLRVAWSFFNAFIWEEKSHQERVLHEARKMMH